MPGFGMGGRRGIGFGSGINIGGGIGMPDLEWAEEAWGCLASEVVVWESLALVEV